jgi:hypothetical protein
MFRDPLTILRYEMERRTDLAALAAEVDDLTEAEIRARPVASRWMHDALIALKAMNRQKAMQATVADWAIDGQLADPVGVLRRWSGSDGYVRIGRTELAVKTGQLLWLDQNGLWIDTIFTCHIDPKLKTQTVFQGKTTRSEYYALLRSGKQTWGTMSATDAPGANSQFRMYRPG